MGFLTKSSSSTHSNPDKSNNLSQSAMLRYGQISNNISESENENKNNQSGFLIQRKLAVGASNDHFEKEADSTADKVVQRLSNNNSVQTKCDSCKEEETVQKKDLKEEDKVQKKGMKEEEKIQKKDLKEEDKVQKKDLKEEDKVQKKGMKEEDKVQKKDMKEEDKVQKKDMKEDDKVQKKGKEEEIQTKPDSNSATTAAPSVESSLSSSKGSGSPLPNDTKSQMESSFGADFSGVRIHSDNSAAKMSEDLGAQAFTHGNDIYFNNGKYDDSSSNGKHLLAHELTHTIQQGGSVRKKAQPGIENTIQKAPAPAPEAPVSSEVVNISNGKFIPSEKVKGEIEQAGNQGLDVRVAVPNISGTGKIKIKNNSSGNFDSVSQKGYIPASNPWAKKIGGLYLRFAVKTNDVVEGFVSPLQTGGDPNDFIKKIQSNSAMLGGSGLKINKLPPITNEFKGDSYKIGISDLNVEVGGFVDAKFNFNLENDEAPKIDATANVKVKGAAEGQLILNYAKEKLTGEVNLAVNYEKFTGNVTVKYLEDGNVDIHGKATCKTEKLSGELNFVSTDLESANNFAKDAIKAAGGVENAQNASPPASIPAPKPGKKERGLAAAGQLQFDLTKWFAGTVNVVVDSKGQITVIGKIAPPAEIQLFPQKDYDKEILSVQVEAGYGIPVVGTIGVFAGVILSAVAYIGPAKIYNIEILGTYSTDPTVQKNIQIAGSVNVSAYAGLRLRAEGGAKLTIIGHDLKMGVGVNADVGVKAYADARPTIGYRDPGEFFISGTLEMLAQPMLGLGGDFFIQLDAPWWSPVEDQKWTWPIGSKEWPLTDPIGLSATMKEYVLGSGNAPDIEFKKPEFDPSKFMTSMVDKQLPEKSGKGTEGQGTFKEDGSVTKPEVAGKKAQKPGKDADKKGKKETSTLKGKDKKTPPDPKAQQEAAKLFSAGSTKLKSIKGPLSKGELRKDLDNIEKGVPGIRYEIKLDGSNWIVTSSAKGINNPKPFKISAIVTEEDKKAEGKAGKKDNIKDALSEIDTEGKKKADGGEVTQKEAEAIKDKVNADHPSAIKISSVKDSGETWDFEYVQTAIKSILNGSKASSNVPKLNNGELVRVFNGKKWEIGTFENYEMSPNGRTIINVKMKDYTFGKREDLFDKSNGWKKYSRGIHMAKFSKLDSLQRATGVNAKIGLPLEYNKSSRSTPVGFISGVHERGHLLGAQFGGGGEIINIVPLFPSVNSPLMSGIEAKVREAIQNGEIVQYSVIPMYKGNDLIPYAITIQANGDLGFSLNSLILNNP